MRHIKIIITDWDSVDGSGFIAMSENGEEIRIGWLRALTCEELDGCHGDFMQAPDLKEPDSFNQILLDALKLTPLTIYLDGVSKEFEALINDQRQHVMVEWASHDDRGAVTLWLDEHCEFDLGSFELADTGEEIFISNHGLCDKDYYFISVSFDKGANMEDVVKAFIKKYPQVPFIIMNYLLNS